MVTTEELQAQVEERFELLGLPSWPHPHPDLGPLDEEYSRLTDPGRYAVVHARARVWAEVLAEVVGARVDRLPPEEPGVPGVPGVPGSGGAARRVFDRGVRVASPRPDTLPLLLLESDVRDVRERPGGEPLPVLAIAVGRPDVVVDRWPDCGCDACDDGSEPLLDDIDGTIAQVVGGPFVVLHAAHWGAQWSPERQRAHSEGSRGHDFDALMRVCRGLAEREPVAVPAGAEAFIGRSWLG